MHLCSNDACSQILVGERQRKLTGIALPVPEKERCGEVKNGFGPQKEIGRANLLNNKPNIEATTHSKICLCVLISDTSSCVPILPKGQCHFPLLPNSLFRALPSSVHYLSPYQNLTTSIIISKGMVLGMVQVNNSSIPCDSIPIFG